MKIENMQEQNTRNVFACQPARILLVHLTSQMTPKTCLTIHQCLEQFFALTCNLSGPCRIPFFGLIALGSYPEVLFPLQQIRGNYPRLHGVLEDLQNYQTRGDNQNVGDVITQGIHEAAAIFRRQAHQLLQLAGYWPQLEMTILTSEEHLTVTTQAESAIKGMNMDSIKKILIISLKDQDVLTAPEDAQLTQSSDTSGNSGLTGVIDYLIMDNYTWNLNNHFMGWLHDTGTDKEHVHLLFPMQNEDSLCLKCDIQERVLSPSLLPHQAQYSLSVEAQMSKPPVVASSRSAQVSVPVYHLEVVNKIPVECVCESVLYGEPQIIQATTCWKIDWDELESNQQHFHALCHHLNKQNQALVVKRVEDSKPTATPKKKGIAYKVPPPKPRGYFLLLSSQKASLLIKPIAVSELLLPTALSDIDNPPEQSLILMDRVLDQVSHLGEYNPLSVCSELHQSLHFILTKNLPSQSLLNKRKTPSRMQETPSTQVQKASSVLRVPQVPVAPLFSTGHIDMPPEKRPEIINSREYYGNTFKKFPTQL